MLMSDSPCPKCGSIHTVEKNVIREDYYYLEYDIVCAKCGNIKDSWHYGHYDIQNWMDLELEFHKKRYLELVKKVISAPHHTSTEFTEEDQQAWEEFYELHMWLAPIILKKKGERNGKSI